MIADDVNAYSLTLSIAILNDGSKIGYAKKHIDEDPGLWREIKKEAERLGEIPAQSTSDAIVTQNRDESQDFSFSALDDVGGYSFSDRVTDKDTLAFLNKQLEDGDVVEVYRCMQTVGGKLYPPMSGTVNGKWQNPSELNAWEQSTEITDFDAAVKSGLLIPYKNKSGETLYKFKLTKGKTEDFDGGTPVPADYAPYIHTSLSMLNDQFTSAYKRKNLVVVRGYVPKSELNGAYHAPGAKKATGETTWHSGVVAAQMPDTRKVILSRYFLPAEVLSNKEVAKGIKASMKGKDIEIPYNVVSPGLREALENEGVRIGEARGLPKTATKDKVSFSDRDGNVKRASELREQDLRDLLERASRGELGGRTYIPLRRNTPRFFIGVVREHSKGRIKVLNVPMASTTEHIIQNMEDRDGADYENGKRPHGLDADDIVAISKAMDDPQFIVLQRNGRYAEVVSFYSEKRHKNVVVSIDIAVDDEAKKNFKYAPYMNGYDEGYYNIVVTEFEPDDLRRYLNANEIVYDKKKMNGKYQVGSGRIVAVTHDTPFIDDTITRRESESQDFSLSDRDSDGNTLSKAQQEYFKDSKVRDENGSLKVMYHGTRKHGFTIFEYGKQNFGLFGSGFYFTENKQVAEEYSKDRDGNQTDTSGVYSVYLNITAPLDMDAIADKEAWVSAIADTTDYSTSDVKQFLDELISERSEQMNGAREGIRNSDMFYVLKEVMQDAMLTKEDASEAAEACIRSMGYDGITHIGGGRFHKSDETRHRVYIAFEQNQIKNTDNRSPTENADIRYSDRGDTGKNIRDDIYYPKNKRDASAFIRSFANKTSGLKKGEKKNILIFTANDAYFVEAEGYLKGEIYKVVPIAGNEDLITDFSEGIRNGTDRNREAADLQPARPQRGVGRNIGDRVGSANRGAADGADVLDGGQSGSDDLRYYWENYGYPSEDGLREAIDAGAIVGDDNGNIVYSDRNNAEERLRENLVGESDSMDLNRKNFENFSKKACFSKTGVV